MSNASPDDAPAPRGPWSKEEETYLRWAYSHGLSVERAAKHLGRSVPGTKQKAARLGLRHPRSGREEPGGDDLASRLRVLLGEEARAVRSRRLFTDKELLRFTGQGLKGEDWDLRIRVREHVLGSVPDDPDAWARLRGLDLFCREVVGLELMDHQLAMAFCCLASKRALCLAGRQSGKDYTQAALALWEAVTVPNARLVLVSAAQRQSDELVTRALLGFVSRHEKLYDSVLRSSREVVEFTNGSRVHALPASGLIRGLTATRVLVNEAREILDEEATFSAVEPMLLTTDGPLAIFTTPLGRQGRIWAAFNAGHYLKTQIPSRVSRYAKPDLLERERLEMSAATYACEFEAQFMDVSDSYFSAESIQRCARDYDLRLAAEEGETYSLGIDWARTRDTSVMLVVARDEEDHLRLTYLKAYLNVPMPDQVAFVRHLHNVFHFGRIVSEYAGLGIGPTDQLKQDLGLTVEAFKPSVERKALGYDGLKSRLEKGTLTIPMHPKLVAELRTLAFRLTPSGALSIHGPSDDYVDALMLACWPFRPRRAGSPGLVILDLEPPAGNPLLRPERPVRTCETCGRPIEGTVGVDVRTNAYYHADGCPPEPRKL